MKLLAGASLPTLPFVVINAVTGEILRTGVAPAELVEVQAGEGELAFAGYANDALQYIDTQTESVMSKQQIVPVVDGLTITGLPNPCTAHVEDQHMLVEGGKLTIEFDVPGTYSLRFSAPCWLDATVEVVQP